MLKIIKIILILFVIIIIVFNKKIISYYYINKLTSWIERPIEIEQLKFNYTGYVEIKGIQILNSKKYYHKNIFEADKIKLNLDTKSFFSDLIVIKNINIINPEFFLDIEIVKKNQNSNKEKIIYNDNIGLAKKINEKMPDKIWPKKNKDINFIILESVISGAKANIKVSSMPKSAKINLSKMKFSSFGNEKNYRHYKDILKFILYDLYSRTNEAKLKKILKKIYNF